MLHNLEVLVSLADFQKFDRGEEVEVEVEVGSKLVQPGDRIYWVCAGFDGTAEITKINGTQCTIKK